MSDQNDDGVSPPEETPASRSVASHPEPIAQPLLVAPTALRDFNTLSLDLVAVACLQLPDMLFEFDSSFPTPGLAATLKQIHPLRNTHKNIRGQLPSLSIFGHADPSGDDNYNKQLSGRRAMAIYGVLTRDTKLWDFLFDNPHGGDDWKAKNVQAIMRSELKASANTPRTQLVRQYMGLLSPEPLEKTEFIGKGVDPKGKADFQGCGEFNPVLLLSTEESKSLPKSKRDEENSINRRVIIFLFRAGMAVNPKLWPCPRALEGTGDCRRRFFAPPKDGELRRKPGLDRREFSQTSDTFACRFYDRVARLSPCEGATALVAFRYAVQLGAEFPWTSNVSIRFTSEDASHVVEISGANAITTDTSRTFRFPNFRRGVRYRAEVFEDKLVVGMFGLADISAIQSPSIEVDLVPIAVPEGPAPPEGRGGTEIPIPSPTDEPTRNIPASELTQGLV
jgi:outer membrane protein OmpA-like peptidoglycan-associated protein